MSGGGKVVCVTGASGFFASWLVKLLLQRGYTVRASVRDPKGSFDSLVEGCEGVFHTASPVIISPTDPQAEVIDPAVKGTLNVPRSCIKFPSAKRVVLASSINWCELSKTLAEDATWKFAKENKIDLVTMHPGFTIGPFLQSTLNVTADIFLNNVNGSQILEYVVYRSVDVRDVACTHIQASEVASARASGFIASWLVKLLLQRGYTVKASVPDPNDPKKTQHLLSLDGAKERLHLLKANLLDEGSFDSLVEGCEGAEVIDPAVKGTLNVPRSCVKFPSVKRKVVTSSIVSLTINGKPLTADMNWYAFSKTLAEDATWKFAKENKIDLVTMHLTLSPCIQGLLLVLSYSTLNVAAEIALNHINGSQTLANMVYRFVDVRDVAYAHIQAFKMENEKPLLPIYHLSNEKAEGLGIDFISLEVSLRDTANVSRRKILKTSEDLTVGLGPPVDCHVVEYWSHTCQ
ncbi:hypothetical protein FEM48_Zijuj07G0013400 [Ziziphus jujuba var. spinosa]|uniref:NAD-dependent epimerase/dehydratase domain-containing protein n=1 Tax=Ziziphus jujuba var. spinosa TaxID=714518 RepID=A0A978V1L9_ZIZJJ|nr:hypothetical protein FEM48_Zijuj07G0013400 [Ziziphus jujuba var. spinosa]